MPSLGRFPGQYTKENTIMFDDLRRNFVMNPRNGLRIRAYRNAHVNREKDKASLLRACPTLVHGQGLMRRASFLQELKYLKRYLRKIAPLEDLTVPDHRRWREYLAGDAMGFDLDGAASSGKPAGADGQPPAPPGGPGSS